MSGYEWSLYTVNAYNIVVRLGKLRTNIVRIFLNKYLNYDQVLTILIWMEYARQASGTVVNLQNL